jgi:hypothetical protein
MRYASGLKVKQMANAASGNMSSKAKQAAYDLANQHPCPLRRPRFFPLRLTDIGDICAPSAEHYSGWETGCVSPSVHWTLLVEVVAYQHQNFAGRPEIRCKDADGKEFKVAGYFDGLGSRNTWFDAHVAPAIKPGCVLAIRYAESKYFLDMTIGIRLEDKHTKYVRALPCTLKQLLDAADFIFARKSEAPAACWAGCGRCEGDEAAAADGDAAAVKLSRCARCKMARYCSRACQTKDWASKHKEHCKLVDSIMELVGQGARPFALDDFAATKYVAFA